MAKDSSRITAGELQKKVEFQSQKNYKTAPTSHVVWEGFKKERQKKKKKKNIKKIKCFHQKTNSSIFSYQTQLELQIALASIVR